MSTAFRPIEIPPGVVSTPTKKMRSSNWAEVNFIRWREGQLMPMGGQSQLTNSVNLTVAATSSFTTSSTTIGVASDQPLIRPGMSVDDNTTGLHVGTVKSFTPGAGNILARAAFPASYKSIPMTPNPGWVVAGMTAFDVTTSQTLGTVASYGPVTVNRNANATFVAGATTITMLPTDGTVIAGMTVFDVDVGADLGVVASWTGSTLTLTAPTPFHSGTPGDILRFSSGTDHNLVLTAINTHASGGAADAIQFTGVSAQVITLTAPAANASSGSADLLQIKGEGYSFASRCKRIHGWYDLAGIYHIAYLCEANLYVDTGGALTDITPAGGMVMPAGLVGGFGDDLYSKDTYGTPRSIPTSVAITKIPDAYSLDNFGSILYAMTSADSRLLMWDPAVGGRAVVQPAASGRGPVPHGRCFVVTQERFLMIFGSTQDGTAGTGGSARRFAWCDQENPGAWDYTNVVSQAGFLDIEPASPIICADASRTGVIFWTAKKCYASHFLGLPYIYNYVELCDGATPWSSQSVTTTSAMTLWMTEQGLFSYDGTSVLPAACKVRPWIDDNIDPVQVRELSFACHLGEFNEWWWFYPTLNSPFNTRAAVYNYKEGWWTQCRLSRSAGITSSYTSHPIFADDYVAFQHEDGSSTYTNASMPVVPPFAESFDLNLTNGSRLMTVKQLLPDVEAIEQDNPQAIVNVISNLRYSLFYRNSRSLGLQELQSALKSVRPDGFVDFRTTGRDIRLRIDMASPVVELFTLGQHSIDAVVRGDR